MGRPRRVQFSHALYHITARGVRGTPLALDDADYERIQARLGAVVLRRRWWCYAYCAMPNHFHLVVRTREADIARGMHALNTGIARDFNRKYGFRGHALEDRYHAELIERDEHLLEVLRYVPLNPVRAGLCARPESWPWSSYASVIRQRPALDFIAADEVRRLFGRQPTVAEQRYRAFVEDGVRALACA